jgi:hypothetical protein
MGAPAPNRLALGHMRSYDLALWKKVLTITTVSKPPRAPVVVTWHNTKDHRLYLKPCACTVGGYGHMQ